MGLMVSLLLGIEGELLARLTGCCSEGPNTPARLKFVRRMTLRAALPSPFLSQES
jgi:hypothetical protein